MILTKLKDKEKIIAQPKRKKDERAEVAHWSRIKCTNLLEGLNEELRRREKCIRIFPDEKSCLRLFGAILQGYSEDWISGKHYLSEPIERIRENQKRAISFETMQQGAYFEKELDMDL